MPTTNVFTKLTAKGQTTIPRPVRRALKIEAGDLVVFTIDGETVTLRRAENLDSGFLRLATDRFEDWSTPEAEDAFRDL